jgi:hypothetical protein
MWEEQRDAVAGTTSGVHESSGMRAHFAFKLSEAQGPFRRADAQAQRWTIADGIQISERYTLTDIVVG